MILKCIKIICTFFSCILLYFTLTMDINQCLGWTSIILFFCLPPPLSNHPNFGVHLVVVPVMLFVLFVGIKRCCIVLYCIVFHCVALRCVALRCVALRCVALRCASRRVVGVWGRCNPPVGSEAEPGGKRILATIY